MRLDRFLQVMDGRLNYLYSHVSPLPFQLINQAFCTKNTDKRIGKPGILPI